MANGPSITDQTGSVLPFPLKAAHRFGRGRDMQPIDQFEFYKMGQELAQVARLKDAAGIAGPSATMNDAFFALMSIKNWGAALSQGKPVSLVYSKASLDALMAIANQIWNEFYVDDTGSVNFTADWQVQLPSYRVTGLKEAFRTFENNLAAELGRAATYYVPKRGIYDTDGLINGAWAQFSDDLLSKLRANQAALNDYGDAGRCLGFDLPTASGIHAVRALEAILADYYRSFGLEPDEDMTIYKYLKGFTEMPDTAPRKPDAETIGWIQAIKDIDRNALMHGRKTLDFDDAVRIFNHVTGTMIAMLQEMPAVDAAQGRLFGLKAINS